MKLSYNWLSQYLPKSIEINELSKILTGIGLEVEGIEKKEIIKGSLAGLVIGEVMSCVPHPNADKLKLTKVNIGEGETLQIVCGAPNVEQGQKVVVAPVGSTVHPLNNDSFPIKKAKIRGEASEGMICAEDEIGLSEEHDGIIVLPADAIVGTKAKDYFQIPKPDFTLEIGLTPNRSDANSHMGTAKDICTYLSYHEEKDYQIVEPKINNFEKSANLPMRISIRNPQSCPRYAGITISGVTVAPSPDWLKNRLLAIGIHPINNIVDITNFVLQEYGQPLHAFDYDKISGQEIIVKNAIKEEKFITLDGKERTLDEEDLMICDGEKPMVIAGVFGGLESGISQETKNVFLESAYFSPKTVRKSSFRHGLRTDAATHFEKGVSMEMVIPALKRATQLLLEIAGGSVASEIIDEFPAPFPDKTIELKFDYLNQLCGKNYVPQKVEGIFKSLGWKVRAMDNNSITVEIPGEHQDIHHPADLVEEVLRIDGLDNVQIPNRLQIPLRTEKQTNRRNLKEKIAQYLAYSGLNEIITNSLTNSKYYPENPNLVRLLNNLSIELDVMRPSMLESGLEVISYNINRKMPNLCLFEFGKTYAQYQEGKYEETELLSIWITGEVNAASWNQKATKADEFYLKGIVENIFQAIGLKKAKSTQDGATLNWKKGKTQLATLKKVDTKDLTNFDIKQTVFYAEIQLENLGTAIENQEIKFAELPRFPSMKRDLALVVDKDLTYDKIDAIAKRQNWESLKDYQLFDVFENEKLGNDKKSLALSFTFQLKDRTLTDEEVDKMMKELIQTYEKDLNALVRS